VLTVTIAQYIDSGMLLKPFCGPSTIYIRAPVNITINIMVNRKTVIFGLLARRALISVPDSSTYLIILNTLKSLSNLNTLMTIKNLAAGIKKLI
jgi:hypothetical protein